MPTQDQRGRGSGQQLLCELPRPSGWGRGKRRFLAPVPQPGRPATSPRGQGCAQRERASEEARHRLGAPRGAGDGDVAAPRAAQSSLGSSSRHGAGEAGGTMNVFRILGDLSHLLAMILLLVKIWRSKSCAGERRPGRGGTGPG